MSYGSDAAHLGGGEGALAFRRYLAALRRYRWLLVLGPILGIAGGWGAARFVPPEYLAQATIWIETGGRVSGGMDRDPGPIRSSGLLSASQGWVDLLKSYVVLDHAIATLRLYLHSEPADSALFKEFGLRERYRPGAYRLDIAGDGKAVTLLTQEGAVVHRGVVGDSIGAPVGFDWVLTGPLPRGRSVEFTVVPPRDAARTLRDRVQVTSDREGTFLRVELSDTDPALAAATVNTVVERFVDIAAQLKREKLTELARILGEQLRQAEANLRASERELQSFRVETITLPSERSVPLAAGLQITQDPVFESFFAMRVELEQIRRDRDAVRRALAAVSDSGLSTDALEVIGAVQRSSALTSALSELTEKRAELRALLYRYTDEHPPVQRLRQDIETLEKVTIPNIAAVLTDELTAREAELNGRIGSASRELQQIPPRAIQEARLQRDVEIAGNLYTMLQQRYEEARLAEASAIPDVRILDAAVKPERPVKNRAMQLLLLGLVAGLGLGVGSAVLLDRFDRRLQYPEQVTAEMGLPILGVIPHFKGADNGTRSLDAGPVVEALRGIRMNIMHAYGAAGPLVLTVSSPGSGDGKSFVAANLALSFANAGNRVLLIDGDSRRGTLHRVMKSRRKPGLTDFLAGRVSRSELVSETGFAQLHFIGCGTRSKDAPELLGSPQIIQLMTSLRASYNVIIVDSPPLGAGVDAYALSTCTGSLVLVLRTGATDREFAEAKLEVLDRLPVRILGAVLNGVKEWNVYRYYAYYLPGYEHEEDEAAGTGGRLLTGEGNKKA
ncbi:MAG TPA: polysaccharide biosynthesis tyrosine autokinase [Gemmatimonadales bacterium]|nr:polysaccharide biosynthesis tyrosine autokinase [Gemmatimonadales bacterium]